jgi:ankyrin repeat protein
VGVLFAGCSPQKKLVQAVWDKDVATVRTALASGGDPNGNDQLGDPLLCHCTAFGPHTAAEDEIAEALLENHAQPDAHCSVGGTPLINASRNGFTRAVKALISHGANVNATDADYPEHTGMQMNDERALFGAACNGYADIVEALLAAHADKNALNERAPDPRITALQCAQFKGTSPQETSRPGTNYPKVVALLSK